MQPKQRMKMEAEVFSAIRDAYALEIVEESPGPRQRVAETYILCGPTGENYFCKITDNPFIVESALASLPVLFRMREIGCQRVSCPIRTKSGEFHIRLGETLVVLYEFIQGVQNYEYDGGCLGKLIGEIHNLTPSVKIPMPEEKFVFKEQHEILHQFESGIHYKGDDEILRSLKNELLKYEGPIRRYFEGYLKVAGQCRNLNPEKVVTHGDAPGNVMALTPTDLYLIDWDGLLLAPAERDLWVLDHREEFMEGYRSARPDFKTDPRTRSHAIYKYFFWCLEILLKEISGGHSQERGLAALENLEHSLINGFMRPKLEECSFTTE